MSETAEDFQEVLQVLISDITDYCNVRQVPQISRDWLQHVSTLSWLPPCVCAYSPSRFFNTILRITTADLAVCLLTSHVA